MSLPDDVLTDLSAPGPTLTYAFWSCEGGRGGFLFMHTRAKSGQSAEAGVAALLRADRGRAAEVLDYQVQVDNVRGGLETRLVATQGSRVGGLDLNDAAPEMHRRFPALALRCTSASAGESAARQFDDLQAAALQGLVLRGGKAENEFSTRGAAQARFRELTQRALSVRDASSSFFVRKSDEGMVSEEESISWVMPEREVKAHWSGAGKRWRITLAVTDLRPMKARVAP